MHRQRRDSRPQHTEYTIVFNRMVRRPQSSLRCSHGPGIAGWQWERENQHTPGL